MKTKTFLHWIQSWMPRVLVGMEGHDDPLRFEWAIQLIWDLSSWGNS